MQVEIPRHGGSVRRGRSGGRPTGQQIVYRSAEQIETFFAGLDLLHPGVVPCSRWRPDPGDPDIDVNQYCGVGRKP